MPEPPLAPARATTSHEPLRLRLLVASSAHCSLGSVAPRAREQRRLPAPQPRRAMVAANDNRVPAGVLKDGVLTLHLVATSRGGSPKGQGDNRPRPCHSGVRRGRQGAADSGSARQGARRHRDPDDRAQHHSRRSAAPLRRDGAPRGSERLRRDRTGRHARECGSRPGSPGPMLSGQHDGPAAERSGSATWTSRWPVPSSWIRQAAARTRTTASSC